MKLIPLMKYISPYYKPNLYKYNPIIPLKKYYISCPNFISRSSNNNDIYSCNTRITSLFKNGDFVNALKVFDEMPQRNLVTWNCMISGFCRNHMINEARKVFDAIPSKNLVSWTAMLSGYIACCKLEQARNLFDQIPSEIKTHVCWDIMLNGYLKFGRITDARVLFDQCIIRNVGLYNRMLNGYVQIGNVDEAYALFSIMPERDLTSWTSMISCYAKAMLMDKAKAMFDSVPYEKDARIWTTMIQGYMNNGMVDEACNLFYMMSNADIVAWNCMIRGFVHNGRMKDALGLYRMMQRRNVLSSNIILHGFVQEGDMVSALNFFKSVMSLKDVTSWNIMISGYQTVEGLVMFTEMVRRGIQPDRGSYSTIVAKCGLLALHCWGQAIHVKTIKTGYIRDVLVSSSIISMYSKCGLIDYAVCVFENADKNDIVVWNTIIVAQAYNGARGKALELYGSMKQAGIEPNHVTFVAILNTCAHWGLVEEGHMYFKLMQSEWNLAPQAEHYSCMVDLFGRAGMIHEAYELVKQLPFDLPSYTWETLLNCCKLHGDFEVGETVSKRILSINPANVEMNVVLSNIYGDKGMWNELENVRKLIKQMDVRKEIGCSWVELEGSSMYMFFSNDRTHPNTNEIYNEIDNLSNIIKKIDIMECSYLVGSM